MSRFEVIRDTREKKGNGWWYDEGAYCVGTVLGKLDVGDYSLSGFESILAIERKASVSEFANNCTEKRFFKEMVALSKFKYKFILFEFSWADVNRYPEGSNIPKHMWSKIKVRSEFMTSTINSLRIQYGIHVIACNSSYRASEVAFSIMRAVYKNESRL